MTELLTAQDLKRLLKVSLPWVYKLADTGRIPSVRIPCPGNGKLKTRYLVRFREADVQAFIDSHYGRP